MVRALRRFLLALPALALALVLGLSPAPAAWAVALQDFPERPPAERVLDHSAVLSRAAIADLERRLGQLSADHIEAHLITLGRLDYGLSLDQLAQQLVEQWDVAAPDEATLLVLIETQNNTAAIAASPELLEQLPPALLESTAASTMGVPLRDGARYRQASLEALERLEVVLSGGEDPGPPVQIERKAVESNIPSVEQTASSNATTWVIVLLVLGTVVPMLTWWVFSR
ncbi:photosystem II repair protein Psb32 [Cyanobium sp. Morenito 9A2]|uniref:photosystem II repair protein Psb32 n=1 Tax=Cyanobium sp. Morenito 9A2 TaxID=2823718 RepID=UPI0020CF1BFB|nr:TPM domain-containing protein [Cyanobium sp. Morenito 9A2]MCP9850568.1 TPM domain-containing protein [Cyanobium sp. Morenito 9A2]